MGTLIPESILWTVTDDLPRAAEARIGPTGALKYWAARGPEILRKKDGTGRVFKTAMAAYRAAQYEPTPAKG